MAHRLIEVDALMSALQSSGHGLGVILRVDNYGIACLIHERELSASISSPSSPSLLPVLNDLVQ